MCIDVISSSVFTRLPRTELEQTEQLEQLRALEWGCKITVSETERPTIEVDTPEDYDAQRRLCHEHKPQGRTKNEIHFCHWRSGFFLR